MQPFGPQFAFYTDIVRHGILKLLREEGGTTYRYFPHPAYRFANEMALLAIQSGVAPVTEIYVVGHFLLEGPKYFEFDARSCEALEQFELGLAGSDYAQPFPTLMIKLPSDYSKNRVVPLTDRPTPGEHRPEYIMVRHERELARISILIQMDSGQLLARVIHLDARDTIEECWQVSCRQWDGHEKTLEVNPEEKVLSNALTRLGLSACLFAMVYPFQSNDDKHSHRERLARHIKASKKSGDQERIRRAEWELASLPMRYAFKQEVRLWQSHSEKESMGTSGVTLSPHWRRGHYRMQRYGPQNSLRKRIAIHPVLVNASLFQGDLSNTEVKYRL